MIFTEANVAKILAGQKTQTRRVVKSGDMLIPKLREARPDAGFAPYETGFVNRGGRDIWNRGQTYAVQPGRGKAAVARIRITAIRYCERGAYVDEDDARAEGYATPQDFYLAYLAINGPTMTAAPAWALTFVLVDAGQSGERAGG